MSLPGPVVCIVGPTASGKSAFSERVATALGSPVVSVDAMQVYRGMDIGTAKTPKEERACELLMVDVADVRTEYSAQMFQRDARAAIDAVLASGTPAVTCGGTGLYLNAVIDEMRFPTGEKGTESRSRYEALARELGPEGLHALLAERDPKSAEIIHPNNVRRTVRALELLDEGVCYAEHNKGLHKREAHYDARIWGLTMERSRLYGRIERRVDAMIESGLVEEVRGLAERGLTRDGTAGQAIGYKEILEYLDGSCSLEEAAERIKVRTRHYAKRQLSWFGNDARVRWIDLDVVDVADAAARVVADALGERAGD